MQNTSEILPRFSTPEAEITFLREKIANKEQELREKKLVFEESPSVVAAMIDIRSRLELDRSPEAYLLDNWSRVLIIV